MRFTIIMDYLRNAFSKKAQFGQPHTLPSQYPQYFADKAEEDEFTNVYADWTQDKVVVIILLSFSSLPITHSHESHSLKNIHSV